MLRSNEFWDEFCALPTNPWPDEPIHTDLRGVYGYIEQVERRMKGTPLCPFVTAIRQANGYELRLMFPRTLCPSCVGVQAILTWNVEDVVGALTSNFKRRSPQSTHHDQNFDPTVAVIAFVGTGEMDMESCADLERLRNAKRQEVLAQGLMLAHMTPKHSDPNGTGSYVTEKCALLMVRRMHREDFVFMQTEEERRIYSEFFGEPSAGWTPKRQ